MKKDTCWLPNCEADQLSLGLCHKDYARYRAGDPAAIPQPRHCEQCGAPVPIRRGPRRFCTDDCRKAFNPGCEFPGCAKTVRYRHLCTGHSEQQRLGRPLTELARDGRRSPGGTALRDGHGRKWCRYCATWKPVDQFHRDSKAGDGLAGRCSACTILTQIGINYSIDPAQYQAMVTLQGGRCAICKAPRSRRRLAVDHDHRCCSGKKSCGKCVRGLLCGPCNSAIGLMRDDPELMIEAATYLACS
jgi:hypothetical protein